MRVASTSGGVMASRTAPFGLNRFARLPGPRCSTGPYCRISEHFRLQHRALMLLSGLPQVGSAQVPLGFGLLLGLPLARVALEQAEFAAKVRGLNAEDKRAQTSGSILVARPQMVS